MNLIGIPLRKPDFNELTASAVLCVGLWMFALGVMRVLELPFAKADAGALLLVVAWGCVSTRLGIRVDLGGRHVLANLLVSGGLLGAYQMALNLFGWA